MGWFDEQIEYRKKHERELLADSFESIARSVTGRKLNEDLREGEDISDAVSELLRYFGVKEKPVPAKLRTLEEQLDYLLSASGVLYRKVRLEKGWHADAMGAMITTMTGDGTVTTILPGSAGGYTWTDPHTGKKSRVTASNEKNFSSEALCFYRPLPARALRMRDLFRYMYDSLTAWDLASFGLAAALITLVGMLIPKLNEIIVGDVTAYGSRQLLYAAVLFLLFATVGRMLFTMMHQLLLERISTKLNMGVQSAAMMRLLSLPADFFKNYSAGELNQYLTYLNDLCDTLMDSIVSTGITGVFSLVYLFQIFAFARSLVLPSLLITVLTLAISIASAAMQTAINRENMGVQAKERGLVNSLISGVQKIRLSGAENLAFARWSGDYAKISKATYRAPLFLRLNTVLTTAVTMIGTGFIYYTAVKHSVSVADYYAFNSAYAYISTAFTALAAVAQASGTVRPTLELIRPLMSAEPETEEVYETVTGLAGSIELSHVSFRYDDDSPLILDDLSLTIPARQYVAIVGRTGCGKSTLVRLLLGFETPDMGAIYYDRRDMSRLDLRSLRRQIGTVMQDGKLFSGSIFDNIVISAPTLDQDAAWEAAEIAGIADDIRRMPMGMHTWVQDGTGGFSGGQKQRLMIARAVAPKPRVLILDEATSALDNITQKQVSEALDRMKCTRIVIAHRLSTIRHCDRILVLDQGKIIEDGTYEQLIAQGGFFAELVERQRLDSK